VSEVGVYCRLVNHDRLRAIMAEGDLLLVLATSPPCSAKAMVTPNSTLNTAIAPTTLRIDTLRLIPILLPLVGGLVLYVSGWQHCRQGSSSPLANTSSWQYNDWSNAAQMPRGHFWNIRDTRLRS
jgi:hypothetical protein